MSEENPLRRRLDRLSRTINTVRRARTAMKETNHERALQLLSSVLSDVAGIMNAIEDETGLDAEVVIEQMRERHAQSTDRPA